jgi:hypothetical protein
MQARIRRLQGATDGFGDLRHLQTFDFVEDEDGPTVVVEVVESAIEQGEGLPLGGRVLGGRPGRRLRSHRLFGRDLASDVSSPSMCGRHVDRDPVEPGPQLRTPLVLRQLAMDDHEHLLQGVVGVGLAQAEAAKRAPYEMAVFAEDPIDFGDARRDAVGWGMRTGSTLFR